MLTGRILGVGIVATLLAGAGCSHVGVDDGTGGHDLSGTSHSDGGASGDLAPVMNAPLFGVWQVDGKDSRGTYTGQLELRQSSDGTGVTQVYRVVRYTDTTVEDSRELWWAWTGTGTVSGTTMKTTSSLLRADFMHSRGGITRTEADKVPLAVPGMVDATVGNTTHAHFTVGTETLNDTLTNRVDSGTAPIFTKSRTSAPVNSTPDATTKAALFATFASYQALPNVAPYASNPLFQAGVLDVITDTTDYDFYQAHPKALRVVDKVIDAPSLGETLMRANAYGQTLVQKAAYYDAETPAKFIDASGAIDDSVITATGAFNPTGDGDLWTSAYVASQAFRYLMTKDASALPNVAKSVTAIEAAQEITGDPTTFARAVRPATTNAVAPWHTGTGAYAAYDWLENGNNDMFKGLLYGSLTAYMVLCDPQVAGYEALCTRLRKNASGLSTLTVAGGTTNTNYMLAKWISAYENGSLSDAASTIESWTVLSTTIEKADLTMQGIATADWSGTHLNFVEMFSMYLLSQRAPLPGVSTAPSIQKGFGVMRDEFSVYRMGLWSMIFASLAPNVAQADIDNARWRMREFGAPKLGMDVDHRVGAEFVMAPYPSAPWKNDWTTTDRTQSLHGYPAFEVPIDVYHWRSGPYDYQYDTEGMTYPGGDYLHAYWVGRYLGVLTATE